MRFHYTQIILQLFLLQFVSTKVKKKIFCEFFLIKCLLWKPLNVSSTEAIQKFENLKLKVPQIAMLFYLFFQEIYSKYVTPLQPIAKEPLPYVSKHTVSQPLSPYYLSNNDSRKNFMSGISKSTNSFISLNVGIKIHS